MKQNEASDETQMQSTSRSVEGGVDFSQPMVAAKRRRISATTWITVILAAMYFIMYLDRVNISLTAKEMMSEFSLSNTQIGVAFSAFAWPYLFGQLLGGWLAKQWGAKVTLAVCCLVVSVSTICTGFVSGLITLFAVRLILGIGEGPAFSAATSAMRNWYPEKRFGFIQGITHSASRLGGCLAPPPGGLCGDSRRLEDVLRGLRSPVIRLGDRLVVLFHR